MSAMYVIYHGPHGLRKIANRINTLTQLTAKAFEHYGFQVVKKNGKYNFFDTFTVVDNNS
jgi:glycine dehydrogenase